MKTKLKITFEQNGRFVKFERFEDIFSMKKEEMLVYWKEAIYQFAKNNNAKHNKRSGEKTPINKSK